MGKNLYFSTEGYATAEHPRIWQEHIDGSLFPTATYLPMSKDGLRGHHSVSVVDETRVHGFHLNEHAVDRTSPATRGPGDALFGLILVSGAASYSSASSMQLASPGDALLYDPREPFLIAFGRETSAILLEIPRKLLAADLFEKEEACIRITHYNERFKGLDLDEYRTTLANLLTPQSNTADLEQQVRRISTTLTRAVSRNGTRRLFLEAIDIVEREAHDHELSINLIAARLSMSARQLNRVFRANGTTASASIAAERICRAQAMLKTTDASITQIALGCGFRTSSNFSRAFLRSTGLAPSAYRMAADPN